MAIFALASLAATAYGAYRKNKEQKEQAGRANQLTADLQKEQQAFNSAEAQKSRDWQEKMSNTAHQRQVQDLKAAGLNPMISANSGASTPGGATATSGMGQGQQAQIDNELATAMQYNQVRLAGQQARLVKEQRNTEKSKQAANKAKAMKDRGVVRIPGGPEIPLDRVADYYEKQKKQHEEVEKRRKKRRYSKGTPYPNKPRRKRSNTRKNR